MMVSQNRLCSYHESNSGTPQLPYLGRQFSCPRLGSHPLRSMLPLISTWYLDDLSFHIFHTGDAICRASLKASTENQATAEHSTRRQGLALGAQSEFATQKAISLCPGGRLFCPGHFIENRSCAGRISKSWEYDQVIIRISWSPMISHDIPVPGTWQSTFTSGAWRSLGEGGGLWWVGDGH